MREIQRTGMQGGSQRSTVYRTKGNTWIDLGQGLARLREVSHKLRDREFAARWAVGDFVVCAEDRDMKSVNDNGLNVFARKDHTLNARRVATDSVDQLALRGRTVWLRHHRD